MADFYAQLEELFRQLGRLEHAITFLHWDQLVMMPSGGSASRAEAIAELSSIHHRTLAGQRTGELLDQAEAVAEDEVQRISLREMRREYRWATCIPAELVKAKSLAGSRCEHEWRSQRQRHDWPGFLNNFREVVSLSREEAQARQSASPQGFATPYDALLDLYCTGDSSRLISAVFAVLKEVLPPLLAQVMEHQATRPDSLPGHFPVGPQRALNRELAGALGFDFSAGRIDESSHPFSTGDHGDHRITSRYREDDFLDALKATAHESGHAAYEAGLPGQWQGLPLGQARNMSIHESQSLLFEKQIFLAKPFLRWFTPKIYAHLHASAPCPAERLWLSGTRVRPSYIRVEADEVSYPLHVILRYEIEAALINGTMAPEELPEAWDQKMRAYLGLATGDNHRDGCLQDIHWTDGSFGYFPAYTLGALNSAQIFAAFRREHGDWQELLGTGETGALRAWLGERIWSRGRLLESQDLMRQATGEETSPAHFLAYLRERYLEEAY